MYPSSVEIFSTGKTEVLVHPQAAENLRIRVIGEGGFGKVYHVKAGSEKSTLAKRPDHSFISKMQTLVKKSELRLLREAHYWREEGGLVTLDFSRKDKRYVYFLGAKLRARGELRKVDIVHLLGMLKKWEISGMSHRDLKLENFMRNPKGVIQAIDYGLARSMSSQEYPDSDPESLGTPGMRSPELLRAQVSRFRTNCRGPATDVVSRKCDTFAMGLSVCEWLLEDEKNDLKPSLRLAVKRGKKADIKDGIEDFTFTFEIVGS